jgi:hypothetical protein
MDIFILFSQKYAIIYMLPFSGRKFGLNAFPTPRHRLGLRYIALTALFLNASNNTDHFILLFYCKYF